VNGNAFAFPLNGNVTASFAEQQQQQQDLVIGFFPSSFDCTGIFSTHVK
jgi:hypothetical protein